MMPVIKHFDPVMGVDIHIVVLPPGVPTPIPHPHIAMIIDPMDYVPVLGATVFIGPLPRASAGTAGKPIPHIPMGGPFVKPPMNEDEIFMGSAMVLADGDPLSFTALPVLSCQDVGMIAPPRKKPKRSYGMVLPLSIVMGIPLGMPVLVGGPPTINMMALGMSAAMKALGPAVKKLRALQRKSTRIKKISNAIHERAKKLMDKMGVPPNIRNKVHKSICTVTGHPVDVANGKLFTDAVDFELPGPIPLKWERTWFSTSIYEGPLGHGWHHSYDLELMEGNKAVAVRLADGRPLAFPSLEVGDTCFERNERVTLIRDSRGYAMDTIDGLRYRFEVSNPTEKRHRLRFIAHKSTGVKIQFEYDGQSRLRQIIDSGGRFIRLEYNADNLLHKIFLPHPDTHRVEEWMCAVEYHYRDGELVRVDDALQQPWTYEYQNHLLTKETYRNGLSFYFRFDGNDHNARCVETWGDGGIYYRKLSYDLENNITHVQDSLGYVTEYHHNQVVPHRIIDPLNSVTNIEYNEYSQITCETNALGFKKAFEYDDYGNTTKITNPDGAATAMAYDLNHNLVEVEDVVGGKWQFRYNNHNRLVEEIDPLGNKTSYGYDDVDLVSITDVNQNQYFFEYDLNLNLSSISTQSGKTGEWSFDSHGNVISIRDPRGALTELGYDLLGRLVWANEPDGNNRNVRYDGLGNIVRVWDRYFDVEFDYQGMGRLVARSQSGTTVRFEYDTEERLRAIKNEHAMTYQFDLDAMGRIIVESGFDGLTRRYLRDASGQVRRVLRPGGRYSAYVYDSMGRILEVSHHTGEKERFEYSLNGTLVKASNDHLHIEIKRDMLGRAIKEICDDHWIESEYDALGYRTRVSSSFGFDNKITRCIAGQVTQISASNRGQVEQFITRFTRDDVGAELQRAMPGGIQSHWRRDKLGRPVQQDIISGQKMHSSKSYVWGLDDRLTKVIDAPGRETVFHHDLLGNLTAAQYSPANFDLRMPDAVGNLFRSEAKNDREYGPAGQLLAKHDKNGTTRYQYDVEGNLISKVESSGKVWRYEWNAAGFLRKVIRPDGREVKFEYDALGRRISKSSGGKITRWLWDGDNPLHEWVEVQGCAASDSSNLTWIFNPESSAPMAKIVGGRYQPVVVDHLGVPVAMFDEIGNELWSANIDIWGELRNLRGVREDCPFRWLGQYEDDELGWYYNRFRYYDPEAGQYVSQDPIRLVGGIQFYSYVSDPLVETDVFGLACYVATRSPGGLTVGRRISQKQAIARIRRGGDVFADTRGEAISLAKRALRGKPMRHGPHGDGFLPHVHPAQHANSSHVFYPG